MSQYGWPNCPAGVRAQVDRLLDGFRAILGGNLIGLYLHGSLAMGCFNPRRSDLDLLAVTETAPDAQDRGGIAGLLLAVSRQPAPVEISFLRRGHLVPWHHPLPYDFHYSEDWRGSMEAALAGADWATWHAGPGHDEDLAGHIAVLNRRGLCLWGRPILDVFPAVPAEDYRASVLADVLSPEYGLGPECRDPVYAVLNACRTLAYLRSGAILSKDEGGTWALAALPAEFASVVNAALEAYRGADLPPTFFPDPASTPAGRSLAGFAGFVRREIEAAGPPARRAEAGCQPFAPAGGGAGDGENAGDV